MKVLCRKTCQIRIKKQIHLVNYGEVLELDKMPENGCFVEMDTGNYQIDFLTATESEMLEAKWKASEALAVINEEYDLKLRTESGMKKSEVVAMILDARYRAVN